MIPTPILRRFFSMLAIFAIMSFSTAVWYTNDAHKNSSRALRYQPEAEEYFQKCKRERSDCELFDWTNLETAFQEVARKSNAVAVWWFVAGLSSVSLMVGYMLFAWIMTGSPVGAKSNPTKG